MLNPLNEREALRRIIAKHDEWAAQMPQGEFDDPLSDAIDDARAVLDAEPTYRKYATLIEAVENEVGMGHGAWDCLPPEELVAAVLKCAKEAA